MKKKGISPLIATVLTIGFAIILATLIMNWMRTGSITPENEDMMSANAVITENEDTLSTNIDTSVKDECFKDCKLADWSTTLKDQCFNLCIECNSKVEGGCHNCVSQCYEDLSCIKECFKNKGVVG